MACWVVARGAGRSVCTNGGGGPQIRGTHLGIPMIIHNKDYTILGSIVGSPYLRKLTKNLQRPEVTGCNMLVVAVSKTVTVAAGILLAGESGSLNILEIDSLFLPVLWLAPPPEPFQPFKPQTPEPFSEQLLDEFCPVLCVA